MFLFDNPDNWVEFYEVELCEHLIDLNLNSVCKIPMDLSRQRW